MKTTSIDDSTSKTQDYLNQPDIDAHINKIACTMKPQPQEPRRSIDLFFDACGGHGHPWKCYDYTAKLLKANKRIKNRDKNQCQDLLQSYLKEQHRLRDNKIKRNLAKACPLTDTGDTDGLYQLLVNEANEWIAYQNTE
jgi:hypothetical protein